MFSNTITNFFTSFPMLHTSITALSAKDLHALQASRSLSWAKRQYQAIKDSCQSTIVTVHHVAQAWGVSEAQIIANLRAKK